MHKVNFVLPLLFLYLALHPQSIGQPRLAKTFGQADGFPTSSINHITQDLKGFMWFGTTTGLYRYDGYSSIAFRPVDGDSLSLSDGFIRCLLVDRSGFIWVGTLHGGLCRLDPRTMTFERFHQPQDSIGNNAQINAIAEDKEGNIWVASTRALHRYSNDGIWSRIRIDSLPPKYRPFAIHIAANGYIWIGFPRRTFCRLDPRDGSSVFYDFNPPNYNGSGLVRSIAEDSDGILWMTANDGGLIRFDPKSKACTFIPGPGGTFLSSLNLTRQGNIYLAGSSFFLFDQAKSTFQKPFDNPIYDIETNGSLCSYEMSDKTLWIGTFTGVIRVHHVPSLRIDRAPFGNTPIGNTFSQQNTHYYVFPGKGLLIKNSERKENNIWLPGGMPPLDARLYDLHADDAGLISLATSDGLFRLNVHGGKTKRYGEGFGSPTSLPGPTSSILVDSANTMWVGTQRGCYRFEEATEQFELLDGSGGVINDIAETPEGLWLAKPDNGLRLINRSTKEVISYRSAPGDSTSISNDYVGQLQFDQAGTLWASTLSGLNRYNRDTKTFTRFNVSKVENAIYKMDKDQRGGFLLQTKDGLYRFDPSIGRASMSKLESPINLSHGNGFLHYPWFTWQEDDLLAECHVDSITPPSIPPRMVITSFQLDPNNKNPLSPEESRRNPAYRDSIVLEYNQNLFNLEFSAMDFSAPEKNSYAYMLEGFDVDWTFSGGRRQVTYTNLDPGEYTFKVRGTNAYNVWSEQPAQMVILIQPPLWRTAWAYGVYLLGAGLLIFLARRNTVNRERLKAQVAIEQAEKNALKDLDHLKTKFFSNITHEFRTPLTLIEGPAKELLQKANDPGSRQLLQLIRSNSMRLLKLINQLLDLAKLDAREMKLALAPLRLEPFLRTAFAQFTSLAESKGISYQIDLPHQLPVVITDEYKLETIVTNLLSNALKFTSRGGDVVMKVMWKDGQLSLMVTDSGVGIPAEKLNHIFDRFYQVNPTDSSHSEGTGIGLALVKEYAALFRGKIVVQSMVGTETTFTVQIPLEVVKGEVALEVEPTPLALSATEKEDSYTTHVMPLLLVVEDNSEIRAFIRICLGGGYRYAEAVDGATGLQAARELVPDLIISDWMMPVFDGIELCRKCKSDPRTDHIPFIMLTAKAGPDDRLEGLKTGADEYLVKPFNREELLLKIQNMLALRERTRAHLRLTQLTSPTPIVAETMEEKFVGRARTYVEQRIADEQLSVEDLSSEMALSREQCYRKMMSLTGLSPSAFIRQVRLQRAAQWLAAHSMTVSEAAFQSGFNNLSYFSKVFKEAFGTTPSEYRGGAVTHEQ